MTEMDNMSHVMRKPHSWSNKANPTSMLNFCQMILHIGPTQEIRDGNRECYVTFLKPFLGNLWNNNTYFGTKVDQINRKKGLTGIIQSFQTIFPSVQALAPPTDKANQYCRYSVYSKLENVGYGLEGGRLSAIQICDSVEDMASQVNPIADDNLMSFVVVFHHLS